MQAVLVSWEGGLLLALAHTPTQCSSPSLKNTTIPRSLAQVIFQLDLEFSDTAAHTLFWGKRDSSSGTQDSTQSSLLATNGVPKALKAVATPEVTCWEAGGG